MGDRPRIELSTVQLVSSMGAAVTGAILTSYIGDGGTIVGTAVGAGASTAGFAVYKHYLVRTKEKVAPVIVHARKWSPVAGTPTSRGTSPGAQGAAARTSTNPNNSPNGATVRGANISRYASPTSADQNRPRYAADPGPRDPGDARTRGFEQAEPQAMRSFGTVRMNSAGRDGGPGGTGRPGAPADFASDGPGNGRDGDGSGPGKHGRAGGGRIIRGLRDHPRWVVTVASSAAVFLVAMLVITLIEFGTGKPIDASVWGRNSSGTTLGNVSGSRSSNSGTVTPTVSPTPTQSATPGGAGQTAPQPTSSATTAPTPSSVPSVSTAPSQNAPASVAPTGQSPGQQAPSQQAPSQQAPSQQAPGQQAPGQQAPGQ